MVTMMRDMQDQNLVCGVVSCRNKGAANLTLCGTCRIQRYCGRIHQRRIRSIISIFVVRAWIGILNFRGGLRGCLLIEEGFCCTVVWILTDEYCLLKMHRSVVLCSVFNPYINSLYGNVQ
jgi:hypothetical protein